MTVISPSKAASGSRYSFWIVIYTVVLLLVQAQWVGRLPYPGLRGDLLLPLMFGVAVEWSPPLALFWAALWGYAMDVFSGEFWGFHVGSYIAVVCMVNIALEKFEFNNPIYQMAFVGACALGQSAVLGFFLLFQASGPLSAPPGSGALLGRSLTTMLVAPLILFPIWNSRRSGR